ncbi:MAG: aromatic ring-hydroxylating dioxygenase subunit alpha, partial [Alphaproteobacteria bacterium]|nr:aromatic ring-hydroxylating dioxygenase subunit alpha [Alphaproteobacteria bacterium]
MFAADLGQPPVQMFFPEDMFHPRHYRGVRKPVMEAETLPNWCYVSDAFYQREVERIFMKVWNFVDRVDRIPNPGDYFTFDYVGVPTVIIRGHDNKVRAFSNSCRHRGARIVEGKGNCNMLRCPYHAWSYAPEGRLIGAPDMEDTLEFDRAKFGLVPIRLEVWGGFMFINFNNDAISLAEFLGDLIPNTEAYNLDDMVCVRGKEYVLACNWKLFFENFAEQYHIPYLHGGTLNRQKRQINPPEATRGAYEALYVRHPGSRMLLMGDTGFPPIDGLTGRAAEGTYYPSVYPATSMGFCIDGMWWIRTDPLGPHKTRLVVGTCFPRKTVAREDFERILRKYHTRLDATIPEDNQACELQQRGLMSPFNRPGRIGRLEKLVHSINNWVLDRVIGNEA